MEQSAFSVDKGKNMHIKVGVSVLKGNLIQDYLVSIFPFSNAQ